MLPDTSTDVFHFKVIKLYPDPDSNGELVAGTKFWVLEETEEKESVTKLIYYAALILLGDYRGQGFSPVLFSVVYIHIGMQDNFRKL